MLEPTATDIFLLTQTYCESRIIIEHLQYPKIREFSDMPHEPGFDTVIRGTLRDMLRRSKKSRTEIADELNNRLPDHRKTSEYMLSNWANGSKRGYSLPARVIPALCDVLGDDSLQRLLLSPGQIGKLELGECVSKWLDKRFGPWKSQDEIEEPQRKPRRPADATANRP